MVVIIGLGQRNMTVPTYLLHIASPHLVLSTKGVCLLGVTLDKGNERLVVDVPVNDVLVHQIPEESPLNQLLQTF